MERLPLLVCPQRKMQQATILLELPTKFRSGWGLIKTLQIGGLILVTTTMDPNAQNLLRLISCKCRKRSMGEGGLQLLQCRIKMLSTICKTCNNAPIHLENSDNEDDPPYLCGTNPVMTIPDNHFPQPGDCGLVAAVWLPFRFCRWTTLYLSWL
ncbi:hypothetical protein PR048_022857 [Dryococelus australis]|uniref:Uncharacterized protein n=1 Tax=Dryococelus australis TaxID=614101 RepID=A0ABQ9GSE8_9NEOP|nr:hypothetical protein PR048_022857 [Dryococelus australis]